MWGVKLALFLFMNYRYFITPESLTANNTRHKINIDRIDNSTNEFPLARNCFRALIQFIASPTSDVLSFRNKTKQSANWLVSGLYVPCDFIYYRCLGWRNRKEGKYWCVAHQCMYRSIFRSRFACPSDDRVSTSTFCCISRYCTRVFRGQYAGRMRVNYSYAYAKLPKVFSQFHWRRARTSVCAEQLCARSEVPL